MKKIWLTSLVILTCFITSSFKTKNDNKTVQLYAYASLDDGKTWMFTTIFEVEIDKTSSCDRTFFDIQKQFYDYLIKAGYKLKVNAVTKTCLESTRKETNTQRANFITTLQARGYKIEMMTFFYYKHPKN